MMWLPTYASRFLNFNENEKALIATLFDIGTIIGSVLLGLLSDITYGKRSPVAIGALLLATVGHVFLVLLDERFKTWLFVLIFVLGLFVGGISNMVVGSAVADIGKLEALMNNDKAISTITGIIDGTGSLGAAVGQFIIGWMSEQSWQGVFILMTIMVFLSGIPLIGVLIRDIKDIKLLRERHRMHPT